MPDKYKLIILPEAQQNYRSIQKPIVSFGDTYYTVVRQGMEGGRRFTECVSSWLLLLMTEAAGREIADNKVLIRI